MEFDDYPVNPVNLVRSRTSAYEIDVNGFSDRISGFMGFDAYPVNPVNPVRKKQIRYQIFSQVPY